MRTIKFRGRDIYNGEWACGSLFHGISPIDRHPYSVILTDKKYDAEGHLPKDIALGFCCDEVFLVDPSTVGQFTGLHDKNDKEIYEGDILCEIETNIKVAVVYEAPMFCYTDNIFGYKFLNLPENYVIIGNIHDNPELLKGGAE